MSFIKKNMIYRIFFECRDARLASFMNRLEYFSFLSQQHCPLGEVVGVRRRRLQRFRSIHFFNQIFTPTNSAR